MDNSMDIKLDEIAGGVVLSGQNVLSLFIPVRKEYRLPKGHIEYGESPAETVLREVSKNSGYLDLHILADLGKHTVEFNLNGKHVVNSEHYFLMNLDNETHRGSGMSHWQNSPINLKNSGYAEQYLFYHSDQVRNITAIVHLFLSKLY
jgi:hypothetical protein